MDADENLNYLGQTKAAVVEMVFLKQSLNELSTIDRQEILKFLVD